MAAADFTAKGAGPELAGSGEYREERQCAGGGESSRRSAAAEVGCRKLRAQPIPAGICPAQLEKDCRGQRSVRASSFGKRSLQSIGAGEVEGHFGRPGCKEKG